jgi:hypothetical protein
MNLAIKISEIFAAMSNQWTRKRCPGFFRNFNRTRNEKLVVPSHAETSNVQRSTSNAQFARSTQRDLLGT